ncbi:hypothetical protein [Leptolinea tardivitalis]|uniref:Uncharacterized protein n=1 Tax=Leptolinea tardivitalis TaxID=229920 RepID=A0A0P6WWD2_9CHLR|nr:hypothetical protein [Leptolinea tardivitalis]KPL70361.1 hypothetical protein ADM99_14485 [Leptolinea tardivitalis]GAP21928.1 hypothetical protein LTAR_02146 [Leptolinea tardivitalis]
MKKFILVLTLLALLIPSAVHAQEQNPWGEVFDSNGNLRSDLTDLGVTTEHPDWMSVDLPFGQSLNLNADYHRYQTANGNIVVLPSASTLFFMAMNPQESGLANSVGMMGNGYGGLITFLGAVAGNNIDWGRLSAEHPEYKSPDQFWGAVLNGQQDVWTYFSGWGFITTLLQMSWNDTALRTAYLMYLNGAQNCASIPGGCSGVVTPTLPQPKICPDPTVSIQQPTISIQKTAPSNPLVVGQDTENRRGADVIAKVSIPPVIFTWHEPIYEDREVCEPSTVVGGVPVCRTESFFKECREHVEHLPDAVASLQATAALDAASQAWITSKLGQTHYGAYVHQANFTLIPGLGSWSGGCDGGGTCTATGQALKVPFADPGTFNLRLNVVTTGTRFMGISITQPRQLSADGTLQVYVTLPALVP